jgi:hypothetical protein
MKEWLSVPQPTQSTLAYCVRFLRAERRPQVCDALMLFGRVQCSRRSCKARFVGVAGVFVSLIAITGDRHGSKTDSLQRRFWCGDHDFAFLGSHVAAAWASRTLAALAAREWLLNGGLRAPVFSDSPLRDMSEEGGCMVLTLSKCTGPYIARFQRWGAARRLRAAKRVASAACCVVTPTAPGSTSSVTTTSPTRLTRQTASSATACISAATALAPPHPCGRHVGPLPSWAL